MNWRSLCGQIGFGIALATCLPPWHMQVSPLDIGLSTMAIVLTLLHNVNIFVTSPDPIECAVALDDRRLVKMVLETTQLLCTAAHLRPALNVDRRVPLYRLAWQHHPVAVWVREEPAHLRWTVAHLAALNAEYVRRYGRVHACSPHSEMFSAALGPLRSQPKKFCNCSMFKEEIDVFTAYRKTMDRKWLADKENGYAPRWKWCSPPSWRGTTL